MPLLDSDDQQRELEQLRRRGAASQRLGRVVAAALHGVLGLLLVIHVVWGKVASWGSVAGSATMLTTNIVMDSHTLFVARMIAMMAFSMLVNEELIETVIMSMAIFGTVWLRYITHEHKRNESLLTQLQSYTYHYKTI